MASAPAGSDVQARRARRAWPRTRRSRNRRRISASIAGVGGEPQRLLRLDRDRDPPGSGRTRKSRMGSQCGVVGLIGRSLGLMYSAAMERGAALRASIGECRRLHLLARRSDVSERRCGAAEPGRQRPLRERGARGLAADHRACRSSSWSESPASASRRRSSIWRRRLPCFVLPDRRDLADRVVIPAVQDELGLPRAPVRDRVERFRMTARYRESHPGGMAQRAVAPARRSRRARRPPDLRRAARRRRDPVGDRSRAALAVPRAARAGGGAAAAAARPPRGVRLRGSEERRARYRGARRREPARSRPRARRGGAARGAGAACWGRPRSKACRSTRSRARRRSWSRSRATTIRPRPYARSRPSSAPGGT